MVVARHEEDLDWIEMIPKQIKIRIYNKGPEITDKKLLDNPLITVNNNCKNTGRESETYLRYIMKEYNNVNDYVVFAQGSPLDHAPNMVLLLYKMLNEGFEGNYLPLSMYWKKDELPPKTVYESKLGLYYVETASRYTLCPMRHWDDGIHGVCIDYINENPEIEHGQDIIGHFCKMIDLEDPDAGKDTFNFNYSGVFATKKESILKHPLDFYYNCYSVLNQAEVYGYMFERIWMKMFG